jgi:hypothetical protein
MLYSRASFRSFMIVASIVEIAACSEPTSQARPSSIAPDQTTVADGTAGTVLVTPPSFVVKDQSGDALGGVSVAIAVTAGGGTLTDAPTSSKSGATSVGTWKLGNTAGVNSVTITVAGLQPLVISVNGKAGPPASVAFVAGADQSALAGTPVAFSPIAQLRDQFGNGVPGGSIAFGIVEGSGSVGTSPVITNAAGNASSPRWTLGKSAVPQSLRATSGAFTAILSANILSDYNIEVRFFGPAMPASTGAMFIAAAARIRGAVTGDVGDVSATEFVPPVDLADGCGVPGLPTAFSEPIDDLIVYASVGPIDGPNQVLAFSFPCLVRGPLPNRQTAIGIMKFDSEDVDNMLARGILTDVIQHEMLHTVGIGTLWSEYGVLAGAGTSQSRFTGAMGVGGCIAVGGTPVCPGSVPVENSGGAGTADAHWRESVFGNELMTGFVNSGPADQNGLLNPLSAISIQSLADVGYVTNPKAADPYTIPGFSAARAEGSVSAAASIPWEKVMTPKMVVSPNGKVSLIPKRQ